MLSLALILVLASPDSGVAASPVDPVEATRFIHGAPPHGYPGPWALSGFRIGANALSRLGLTRAQAFDVEVVHRAVPSIRYTCMADGLMAATGASPGKMNLSIEQVRTEDELETVVIHRKTKRKLVYRLTKAFRDRIRETDYADFPKAAKVLAGMKDEELFTVEDRPAPQ